MNCVSSVWEACLPRAHCIKQHPPCGWSIPLSTVPLPPPEYGSKACLPHTTYIVQLRLRNLPYWDAKINTDCLPICNDLVTDFEQLVLFWFGMKRTSGTGRPSSSDGGRSRWIILCMYNWIWSVCYCFMYIPENFLEAVPPVMTLLLELSVKWSRSGCF